MAIDGVMMKVSIFMFCRNGAKTVRKAVDSVLSQGWGNIEFVVQDGASTDGTLEVLREYGDRIQLRSEPDSGPEEGFFRALERCSGDIIGSCLVDEQLMEGSIAAAVRFFEMNEKAAALTRDAFLTDIKGKRIGEFKGRPFSFGEYLSAKYVPHFSATFFRGDSLRSSGVLTKPWRMNCGEFELWSRIMMQGEVAYMAGFASKYAIHDDQLSRRSDNVLMLAQGRLEVLKEVFDQAASSKLKDVTYAKCVLGNVKLFGRCLLELGDFDRFRALIGICREYIAIPRESKPIASEWIANALEGLCEGSFKEGLYLDTERMARLAISLWPDDLRFSNAECKACMAQGEWEKAKGFLESKFGKNKEDQERLEMSFHEVAEIFESRGEIDKAIENWDRAWGLPDPYIQSLALVARLKAPESTLLSLLEAHDRWAEKFVIRNENILPLDKNKLVKSGRIKIGVSCSFWTAATIKFQFLSFVNQFDSKRFEIIAYSNYDDGFCGHPGISSVRLTAGKTDEEFMAIARSDELDILIELNGHSPNHRFGAMAMRCAPIQVSYLNYTATSGVREVDYLIADEVACGRDEDPYYRERIHRLPGSFFCFNYEQDDRVAPSDPPSIKNGYVTFGCFSSGGKINPEQVQLFVEVLKRVGESRLIIRNGELNTEGNRSAMKAQFEKAGIPESRLEIVSGLPRKEVLKEYSRVDIALDTYPYNGGNTIAEAIWQGVPIVTLIGDRFSARYGASLLKSSGCSEMIARSRKEYVDVCAGLAEDTAHRIELRTSLPIMMKAHGLSDTEKFASRLSEAFEEMVSNFQLSRDFYRENHVSCIAEETRNANLFGKWVFLTTMPRSGTWFMKYVFHVMNHRLCNHNRFISPPPHLRNYEGLSLNAFHSHASHGRFESDGLGEIGQAYEDIEYMANGDALQKRVAELTGGIPKTVYLYRNPLDQCISIFRHLQYHKSDYRDVSAKFEGMKTPSEYFRGGGLESYMKQFYSHFVVCREKQAEVLMVRYENLKHNPEGEFTKILAFSLGRPLTTRESRALSFATQVAVPENLKAIERLTGGTLGGDQKKLGESHMRGGVVGGWRDHYTDSDIAYLKAVLKKWEVPESCFDFGGDL